MLIDIEKPQGHNCTGCPMSSLFLLNDSKFHYGCNYLHKEVKSGGEFQNYGIRDKDCPFDKIPSSPPHVKEPKENMIKTLHL